jgi:uncharacterized protein (DUF4415 family)
MGEAEGAHRFVRRFRAIYRVRPHFTCGGKSRITMRVDNTTLAVFKARAEMTDGNYQTMMNDALRQFAEGLTLADVVRETIRQELHHA